jgi:F0F1-type ATP synthase membrane subunit b/b'
MTLSNMAIAELSILISFLCFLAIVIKKVWPVLMSGLDSHIENVRNQINSAEKLREESAAALIRADKISSNIQSEIEKYKKKSEERISQLEEENRRYIQALKEKAAQSLEAQMNAELSKQKEMLVDKLADLIAEKLSEKSKDLSRDVSFSEEDLRKLTQ